MKEKLTLKWNSQGIEEECSVDEDFLSELLEVGLCLDQLQTSNLCISEIIARRFQLWEEVGQKKRFDG